MKARHGTFASFNQDALPGDVPGRACDVRQEVKRRLFFAGAAVRPSLQPMGAENPENKDREYNQKLGRFTY
jgi:hypothetical protein